MGALTGVIAGFAAAIGVVAAMRRLNRSRGPAPAAAQRHMREGDVIEFEKDPETGAYRARSVGAR